MLTQANHDYLLAFIDALAKENAADGAAWRTENQSMQAQIESLQNRLQEQKLAELRQDLSASTSSITKELKTIKQSVESCKNLVATKTTQLDTISDYLVLQSSPQTNTLKSITDFAIYLNILINNKNHLVIVVSAFDTPVGEFNKVLSDGMRALGLIDLRSDFRHAYLAVIDCGQIIFEKVGRDNAVISANLEINNLPIKLVSAPFGAGQKSSILVNKTDLALNRRGLNFVIIDKVTKKVLDSVVFDTFLAHSPCYR